MDTEVSTAQGDETRRSSSLSDIDSDSNSDSDRNSSKDDGNRDGSDAPAQPIEWLATARQRRATAGNRMKFMLANEEPDSDLELLFAEDEDDEGFSGVDDDGSDVHMDSSSDDEDDNNAGEGLEGEQELERLAKERRTAQRKRKAQDVIPAKFRKKVRINPATRSAQPAPAPRPKKKSERASWLPSPADMPTRASSRQTTREHKEQLHQQMVEREERRLKQLAQMQKKAAKLEALKKPPLTQAERLHEATLVEKRNSKSLNRWEEAERQREEERLARLAALNQRTLKGPVITFWSGRGHWANEELRNMGKVMVVEEQPKKKREKSDKNAKQKDKAKAAGAETPLDEHKAEDNEVDSSKVGSGVAQQTGDTSAAKGALHESSLPQKQENGLNPQSQQDSSAQPSLAEAITPPSVPTPPPPPLSTVSEQKQQDERHDLRTTTFPTKLSPPILKPHPSSGLAAPAPPPPVIPPPPSSSQNQSSLATAPGISQLHEPRPLGVLAAPMLAPPPGVDICGASSSTSGCNISSHKSNVLAFPNTSPSLAPPSSKPPVAPTATAAVKLPTPVSNNNISEPLKNISPGFPPHDNHLQPNHNGSAPSKSASLEHSGEGIGSNKQVSFNRNAIIYQNFDEISIKDKGVQTQILFGRRMNRLSKPSPAALCVITHHPARYRDPKTELPYYNAYAYREIQRLYKGDYHWSKVLGAWVGSSTSAARGVPERFLNPHFKPASSKGAAASDISKQDAPKCGEDVIKVETGDLKTVVVKYGEGAKADVVKGEDKTEASLAAATVDGQAAN